MKSQLANTVTPEILAEIRRLHFQTSRLATEGVSGQYRSAFRGRGMEFEEVREYVAGDDVRSIDWKVTARTNHPYIKVFREERELTVILAVDVSSSTLTGTRGQLRDELIAKVGAILTMIALKNNDKVGLITFADEILSYHPPRKARSAVWRILHEVLAAAHNRSSRQQETRGTNLKDSLKFINQVTKRQAVVFLISDFFADDFGPELGALSRRHDVTAIRVLDPADSELPNAGLVQVKDPESSKLVALDTSAPYFREEYKKAVEQQIRSSKRLLERTGSKVLDLETDKPFMRALVKYFTLRQPKRVQLKA